MSTNIKLQPSVEILKLTENVNGNIELTKPIDLVFNDAKQTEKAPAKIEAKSNEKPSTQAQPQPETPSLVQSQTKIVKKESSTEISFQKPSIASTQPVGEHTKVNKIEKTKLEPTKVIQLNEAQASKMPEPPNPFNTKMISRDELKLDVKKETQNESTKMVSAPPPPPPISNIEMTKILNRNEIKKVEVKGTPEIELEKSKLIEPKVDLKSIQQADVKAKEIKNPEIELDRPAAKIEIEKTKTNTKSGILLSKKINSEKSNTEKPNSEKSKSGIELPSKVINKAQLASVQKIEPTQVVPKSSEIVIIKNEQMTKNIDLNLDVSSIASNEVEIASNSNNLNGEVFKDKSIEELKLKHSHEIETLKNYLALREQDIAVMRLQVDYSKDELNKAQHTNKSLTVENENLQHQVNSLRDQLDELKSQKNKTNRNIDDEVDRYKIEIRMKAEQIRELDEKVQAAVREQEMLRERVKLDIRKIRVRERELESKLEILKRDSETLIVSRENKIVELKRKIDLLEFNYDMLQEKYDKEKQNYQELLNKEQELAKVLKKALGLTEEVPEMDLKKLKSA